MNSKKIFRIVVECLWVVMAVFCLAAGIYYQTKYDSVSNVWIFYAMAVISVGMFIMRFMQRRNEERRERRRNGEE
jgi:hypothetical protein